MLVEFLSSYPPSSFDMLRTSAGQAGECKRTSLDYTRNADCMLYWLVMKIQVILGSTRQGRVSEKIGAWVMEQAKSIPDVEFELLDLRDYQLPFFDEPVSPSMLKEPYTNPEAAKWTQKIAEGNAYLIITPEYNHGYTAVLKNALDYVYKQWNGKKIGFVGYGTLGAARGIEQLRQVVIELQMIPIRNAVHIVKFWKLTNFDAYNPALKSVLEQLR